MTNSTIVAKLSTGLLHQYNITDGKVMDMQPFVVNAPNNIRRVSDTQVYVFNSSYGSLYNMSLNKMCIGSCNCSLPFVQQGQYCIIPTSNTMINSNITNSTNSSNLSSNSSTPASNTSTPGSNSSANTGGNMVAPSNFSAINNSNTQLPIQYNPPFHAGNNAFGTITKILHNTS